MSKYLRKWLDERKNHITNCLKENKISYEEAVKLLTDMGYGVKKAKEIIAASSN